MKIPITLATLCLGMLGIARAQTTTNTYSTTSNTTNPAYTSPVTTDSTNATNTNSSYSNSSVNGNATTNNGNMNAGTTSGTYSTNTTTTTDATNGEAYNGRPNRDKADGYKNFVFGIYAGLNSTKLPGESNVSSNGDISGRLGYQAGFFVRGGGRFYGQLGAEYFASSSNYFTAGSGQSASSIQDRINIQYVQIPVYVGYKLVESDRGISAVRLQLGVEYANRISSSSNSFNLTNSEIKSGTFNGLGQLGFDAGPVFLDLTYHYGFSDAVNRTGFNGSQRRILSASVGFKF